jgi:predicted CoA-substrate-specific enzyme activase
MGLYKLGIDVGSTTAKVVVLGEGGELAFSDYRRHNAETLATLQAMLRDAQQSLGNVEVDMLITGSAGMGISETFDLPFIQEVVSSAEVVHQRYPDVKTLIDIGGEDAKIIFFSADGVPDIRMNGSCAGGTGAFIDQMATLLNVPVSELSDLAEAHSTIYPMASRCGVFAKTDVQNLLSREIPREDIAASIFNAVVLQTLATLARGYRPSPRVLFSGGPLTFLPALKHAFMRVLKLEPADLLDAERAELLPALGAALANGTTERGTFELAALAELLGADRQYDRIAQNRLPALFSDETDFRQWSDARMQHRIERVSAGEVATGRCFLGVDSGSTTTKVVLIDDRGRIAYSRYTNNNGDPIGAVQAGLEEIRRQFEACAQPPRIMRSVVTGYGEDLIRAAFGFDEGMVETLAHYRAARAFDPDVSFILDIGGQDMKAIFVKDGHIQNIEINEACSSGCGSFIESFARSMGYSVAEFAERACTASAPCDLGTRCTVFMNSKVKQALREGATVGDISAGLAYSVIKNAIHKVLKLTNMSVLGEHIVVQGGTFRNPAIHKAVEHLTGKAVLCPDVSELMGAYGAALAARDAYMARQNGYRGYELTKEAIAAIGDYTKKTIRCKGCQNRCVITRLTFQNENVFFTGNRCERIFTNSGAKAAKGDNLFAYKYDLLFGREAGSAGDGEPILTLGMPRAMNIYENYPFWHALFTACGVKVQLSAPSSNAIYEKGAGTVMSENICFPAKLAHGHIIDLIEQGVDRIFYPMVPYEQVEYADALNSYNCPIVAGYPDVIRNAIDPEGQFGVPFDMPAVTFKDAKLLTKGCYRYLKPFGIDRRTFDRAFAGALDAQAAYKAALQARGAAMLDAARAAGRRVVLLVGRP